MYDLVLRESSAMLTSGRTVVYGQQPAHEAPAIAILCGCISVAFQEGLSCRCCHNHADGRGPEAIRGLEDCRTICGYTWRSRPTFGLMFLLLEGVRGERLMELNYSVSALSTQWGGDCG